MNQWSPRESDKGLTANENEYVVLPEVGGGAGGGILQYRGDCSCHQALPQLHEDARPPPPINNSLTKAQGPMSHVYLHMKCV